MIAEPKPLTEYEPTSWDPHANPVEPTCFGFRNPPLPLNQHVINLLLNFLHLRLHLLLPPLHLLLRFFFYLFLRLLLLAHLLSHLDIVILR